MHIDSVALIAPIWDNADISKSRDKKQMKMTDGFDKHAAMLAMAILIGGAIAANADVYLQWLGSDSNPVWDSTTSNWYDGSNWTSFYNSNTWAQFYEWAAMDVSVDAGGIATYGIEVRNGDRILRGGPVTVSYLDARGGKLTILNTVDNTGFGVRMMGGRLTVGDGGTLDTTFYPWNADSYDTCLTVLTNGILKTSFSSWYVNDSGYKATLYFDGGVFIHKGNRDQKFDAAHLILGAGGLHFQEATASAETWSFLPGPIGTDAELPTDGGIIVDSHLGYMILPNYACTYRGGLHVNGTGGHIGIRNDNNLGAVPESATDNIFFNASGASTILIGHGNGVTLDANRGIRIADGALARMGAYAAGSSLTVKGTISSDNPENGILQTYPYSQSATSLAGPVTFDPGEGRTNTLGRFWIGQPTVVASGTTLLMNSTDIGVASENDETYGINNGSPLNISGGGQLTVRGGVLSAPVGDRPVTQSAILVVDGGLVDFDGHQMLHAHAGSWIGSTQVPAITTVRNGGRLNVSRIRMAGDGCRDDASRSVLNIETGGVVRVKGSLYIEGSQQSYKGTVNFNGGALEWARPHNSWEDSPFGNDNDATRDNIAYNVLAGGMNVTNDVEMWFYPAVKSGVDDGETDGGLTKWGTSTFALMNTGNTFNGPLVVMQGTVSLGANGALPATATVRVNSGARFNMNGRSQTLARIEGTGSFVSVNTGTPLLSVTTAIAPGMGADSPGALTLDGGCNIADNTTLEVDVAADGTSDCFNYPAQLDLSKMMLHVNDVTKLNDANKYIIAELPNGIANGALFKSTNLPGNWRVRYYASSHELKVVPQKGTVIRLQ